MLTLVFFSLSHPPTINKAKKIFELDLSKIFIDSLLNLNEYKSRG